MTLGPFTRILDNMKKLLVALILSAFLLSGCGIFRSHHAWKKAKQENPLQIPPNMDRPAISNALTIPPPSSDATKTAAQSKAPAPADTDRMHLSGDVDTAYQRVGLALQRGDLGTVMAQDAVGHTYTLSINKQSAVDSSPSFTQKHFSNVQQQDSKPSPDTGVADDDGRKATVTLRVSPASQGGSLITASGAPQQAEHVISVLRGRLGG